MALAIVILKREVCAWKSSPVTKDRRRMESSAGSVCAVGVDNHYLTCILSQPPHENVRFGYVNNFAIDARLDRESAAFGAKRIDTSCTVL